MTAEDALLLLQTVETEDRTRIIQIALRGEVVGRRIRGTTMTGRRRDESRIQEVAKKGQERRRGTGIVEADLDLLRREGKEIRGFRVTRGIRGIQVHAVRNCQTQREDGVGIERARTTNMSGRSIVKRNIARGGRAGTDGRKNGRKEKYVDIILEPVLEAMVQRSTITTITTTIIRRRRQL